MIILTLFALLLGGIIAGLIVLDIIYIFIKFSDSPKGTKYEDCSYYKITKNSYFKIFKDKGLYGEYLIYRNLFSEESKGAKFLFNCYLPRENSETTEIDVLMIHKSGIYVFESKNYSGWIFGNEKDKMWTQTLPQGRKSHKERFFSPIKQNELHIKWLKNIIGDENIPIYSIIVFSERCTLKKVDTPNYTVIKRDNVGSTVKKIASSSEINITENMITEIYDKLYPYTQVSEEDKSKHIENINNRISSADDTKLKIEMPIKDDDNTIKTDENICPKCGNTLVLRTAKKGENAGKTFYGCSAYPKCRYIRNIE